MKKQEDNKKYKLFKGFLLIGVYDTIWEAKKKAPCEDGVYNLIGYGYRDSWQILKGRTYNGG